MRTLDNNLLKTGTVEATFPDPNYVIANLYDNTLRSLFQTESTESSSTITVAWDADVTISTLAVANHNINTATLTLKDSGGSTLDTQTYTAGSLSGTTRDYFTAVSGVRSVEFAVVASAAPVSIGYLYIGQYTQWPNPNIEPTIGHSLTGSFEKTESGILTGKSGVLLESYTVTFSGVGLVDQGIINDLVETNQANTAIFVDRYEDSTSDYPLLFVNITNLEYSGTKAKNGTYIDGLEFRMEECK